MNERIRQLLNEATVGLEPDLSPQRTVTLNEMEKFAELIVAECVNVLDPNGEYTEKYKHSHTPGPDGLRQVLSQEHYFEMLASKKIKQHFGVEL